MNAKKEKYGKKEALALAKEVRELYVAKGKKVIHVDLKKDKPDDETLTALMLGPTGNLRAPTFRIGKTLVVGFDAETYAKVFG